MKLSGMLAVLGLSVVACHAHELPAYDLDKLCTTHSEYPDKDACLKEQKRSLGFLPSMLERVPKDVDISLCLTLNRPHDVLTCVSDVQSYNHEKARFDKILVHLRPGAAPLPRYDIDKACRANIDDLKDRQARYDRCFFDNQFLYDHIKYFWPRVPSDIAAACAAQAERAEHPIYQYLLSCVRSALAKHEKEQALPKREFRY